MAAQVLHTCIRRNPHSHNLLCRLWRNIYRHTNASQTISRRALRSRSPILHLHGQCRHLLPQQHQHLRRHKWNRSLAINCDRLPTRSERLPLSIRPLSTPSNRLPSLLPLLPPTIHRSLPRPLVPQLVPR